MTVLAIPNQLQHPRLGLAISRKVANKAVSRNRIKRLIRESYRHWQSRLDNLDIVILGRVGVAKQSNRELDAALETGMQTAWLVRDDQTDTSGTRHPVCHDFSEIRI